jgi:hypothetical protein
VTILASLQIGKTRGRGGDDLGGFANWEDANEVECLTALEYLVVLQHFLVAECFVFTQEFERCLSYRVSVYPVVRSDGWRIRV